MSTVIKIIGVAGFPDTPFAELGKYVESCDFEAYGGRGNVKVTTEVGKAKAFPSVAAAQDYWRTPSKVDPVRPDGKLNRPLTAYTVEILFV